VQPSFIRQRILVFFTCSDFKKNSETAQTKPHGKVEQNQKSMLKTMLLPPWSPDRESREQVFRTMHANATKCDPSFIGKIRKSSKEFYAEKNCDVSIAMWTFTNMAMHYTPQFPLINVVLQELFPVLEGAVVSGNAFMRSFVPPGSSVSQMHVPFDTVLHGQVMVSCVGINEGCRMELVQTNVEEHAAPCHCLRTYPMEVKEIANCGVGVSLIHQRSCCRACGKEDTREAKLLRCGRCWKTLCAPVWYCNAECQAADYPRHKKECGRVPEHAL
jgi:hypothetical protein